MTRQLLKFKKLKDIIKDPTHPLMQDVKRNHQTSPGDTLECIRCNKKYERGVWDFYSLCNECFQLFDNQKMKGRFSILLGGKKNLKWHESVEEWIKND